MPHNSLNLKEYGGGFSYTLRRSPYRLSSSPSLLTQGSVSIDVFLAARARLWGAESRLLVGQELSWRTYLSHALRRRRRPRSNTLARGSNMLARSEVGHGAIFSSIEQKDGRKAEPSGSIHF